ncbi:MAG: PEP-CTERM sorting domain-containing protein [Fimbriimonadales bacterium]|nr:PEP-CTERM sorting domain-containing protein [Fimbriimonadales bacterium]
MTRKGWFAVALAALACGANAVVLFEDGFETGDFSKWDLTLNASGPDGMTIVTSPVNSGSYAAKLLGLSSGSPKRLGKVLSHEDPNATFRLSFYFYDDKGASLGGGRHYLELRAYSGNGFEGTLLNLWAIGKYNTVTSGTYNGRKYQARVAFGGVGWINLSSAPDRSVGWHLMEMEITPTLARFYVDGVLGAEVSRGAAGVVDSLVMGSGLSSANIDAWIDDVRVTAVPEPATLVALGAGAAGLLLRRRRR